MLAGVTKHLSFLIDWTTVVKSLFYLRGSTKKIQGRSLDLLDVVGQIEIAWEDLVFSFSFETTAPKSIFHVPLSTHWKWPP